MHKFQIKRPPKNTIDAAKFVRGAHAAELDEKFEGLPVRVDSVGAYVMAGVVPCRSGNYVVKDVEGKLDVVPAADFEAKYEPWAEDVPELQNEYIELANELAIVKAQLEAAENKASALNTGYDEIVAERDALQKTNKALEKEVVALEDEVAKLKIQFGQTKKGK